MTDTRRAEVVARLVAAQDAANREFEQAVVAYDATDAEQETARVILRGALIDNLTRAGQLQEPADLLAMDLHQVRRLAGQGVAIGRVVTMLEPHWMSRPGMPLSTILATEPRRLLADLATTLHRSGITDLDDFLPE